MPLQNPTYFFIKPMEFFMKNKPVSKFLFVGLLGMMSYSFSYADTTPCSEPTSSSCPCSESIKTLKNKYSTDSDFHNLLNNAFINMQQLPPEYPKGNPWIGKRVSDLVQFFGEWCTFLPTIDGTHDTGLEYIQKFAWFYYKNQYGVQFVQQSPGREITQDFAKQRGQFMDSKASTQYVQEWLADPRIEKEDYNLPDPTAPDGGFKSFNEFFSRTLKDQAKSRPQTMPERDYVISAPTDCIMNSVPQLITDANTLIPTKSRQALNISDMLDHSAYANKFIGGTALSCVLMPNTYHHYHAPVSGQMLESKIITDSFYGYDNFPEWVPPNGNVGYYGTDFSQFENFQRGYFIVDTGKYGYVAMIPVGLDTINTIVFEEKFQNVTPKNPVPVTRGDRLGDFLYGGSLFITIFEPGKYQSDAIQVRLGNQIGTFDTPNQITFYRLDKDHDGNLGGRAKANELCKNSPNKPIDTRTAFAFLSTSDKDIKELVTLPAVRQYKVVGPNGIQIASNWDKLWTQQLDTSLKNAGIPITGAYTSGISLSRWWSGSTPQGTAAQQTCDNWTSNTGCMGDCSWGVAGKGSTTGEEWLKAKPESGYAPNFWCSDTYSVLCAAY